jgi:hypothetical protein
MKELLESSDEERTPKPRVKHASSRREESDDDDNKEL